MEPEELPSDLTSSTRQLHRDAQIQSIDSTPDSKVAVAVTGSEDDAPTLNNVSSNRRANEDNGVYVPPRTREQIVNERIKFVCSCFSHALVGWNDASTGPLLLRVQRHYHVSYVIVSLIFIFAFIGFITGALLIVPLTERLGFGKTFMIGSILPAIGYSLQAAALPFPVYIMSFTVNGIGMALLHSFSNGFVAALKHNSKAKMGVLHAAYGVGALCSPLVATQFAQLPHWSFHYLVSLGLAILNLIVVLVVFKLKTLDECLAEIGQPSVPKSTSQDSTFSQIMRSKSVHLLAFFLLVYVGVEVTIGGWIVTFIVTVRHGGPSSGYISTGFFGGLTLGRVALLWLNRMVGERRVIFLYATLAIGLDFLIWFTPSLIGDAVAISIIGLLLGPMYPIAVNHAGSILPPWILTGAIGWLGAFGHVGSALLPFMTGAVAQRWGIKSLQPLLVILMFILMVLWALVPSHAPRRSD